MTFISKTLSLAFLCDCLCWVSVTYFKLSANIGRKLIGEKALMKAEKQTMLPKLRAKEIKKSFDQVGCR